MLEPKSVRLHAARRAAIVERLKSAGWPPDDAEAAVVDWEAIADAEGRERGRSAYWDDFDEWSAERRPGST